MRQRHYAVLATGIAILALVLVGVMAGVGGVGADSPDDESEDTLADRSITVGATGGAEAAPDQAELTLAVTAEGEDGTEVRDEIAIGAEDLRDALDELGVEYETRSYAVEQTPRYLQEERDMPPYAGHQTFGVELDDPDRAGEVIDAAVDAGAEIENVELTLSEAERNELREEAIVNAMEDARYQAETIATAGGLEVTSPESVDASQRSYRTVSYEVAEDDGAMRDAPPTQIDAGDVSVTYEVQVTYGAQELHTFDDE